MVQKKQKKFTLDKVVLNLIGKNENFLIEAFCKNLICLPLKDQPIQFLKENCLFIKDLNLADSGSNEEIDILIGSDYYWTMVTGKIKMEKKGNPVAIETIFGRILNGPISQSNNEKTNNNKKR